MMGLFGSLADFGGEDQVCYQARKEHIGVRPQQYFCKPVFSITGTIGGFPNGQETEL